MQLMIVTICALAVFCGLMVWLGVYTRKHSATLDGFLLGGRKIGAWMSAFAYGTSYFSAVIFIGYAGKNGWDIGAASIWIGVGNALVGCLLAWLLLARRTRAMTHTLGAKTMPEFFEGRYAAKGMKLYSALLIFIFLVPYSSAVYKGLGAMFNTIFPGVSVNLCMLAVAAITGAFLVLGGYVAAVYTDFVQGLVMIAGTLVMILLLTYNPAVGGFLKGLDKLRALSPGLVDPLGGGNWKFLLTNILLTSFGTWGLPQMVNKYYAVRDKSAIRKATVVSTCFALLIGFGAYYTGSLGRLYLGNTLPAAGYDSVVPNTLLQAFGDTGLLSNLVLAVMMVLLLSASMSTLSSIVLTSASAISVDLLPFVLKRYEKKQQMVLTRGLCLLFVALSYLFATLQIAIIVSIMSFSWGVVSGSFIGPYVLGLYCKRVTRQGAWAGMLGGFGTVAAFTVYKTLTAGFPAAMGEAPTYGVAAMATSLALTLLVSLATPAPGKAHIAKVFAEGGIL
jgi:SSS family solute:Na+ symporter/sodium/proline symporter